jgi:hypothetical protein
MIPNLRGEVGNQVNLRRSDMVTKKEIYFYKKIIQKNYKDYLRIYLSLPKEVRRELLHDFDAGNMSKFIYRLNQVILNMAISDNPYGDCIGIGSFSTLPKYF